MERRKRAWRGGSNICSRRPSSFVPRNVVNMHPGGMKSNRPQTYWPRVKADTVRGRCDTRPYRSSGRFLVLLIYSCLRIREETEIREKKKKMKPSRLEVE